MFYPEYVDMEMEYLGEIMELEMNKFLHEELPCHMSGAFSSMCKKFTGLVSSVTNYHIINDRFYVDHTFDWKQTSKITVEEKQNDQNPQWRCLEESG